jgi:flagellar biosynthesis protein FlhB
MQSAGLLAALVLVPAAVSATSDRSGQLLRQALQLAPPSWSAWQLAGEVLRLTLPLAAAATLTSVAFGVMQTGGVISARAVVPDSRRVDPVAGFGSLLSGRALASLVRALVTALVVGGLVVGMLLEHPADLAACAGRVVHAATLAHALALLLGWAAALVGLALAGVDLALVRHWWQARLRMTRGEVRQELKESEGDPELKAARQRVHSQLLRGASLAAVAGATVVVADRGRLASALSYAAAQGSAPRVVAHGQGELAGQLVAAARQHGVPVVSNPQLARSLSSLEHGDPIPPRLYQAVAEALNQAWRC